MKLSFRGMNLVKQLEVYNWFKNNTTVIQNLLFNSYSKKTNYTVITFKNTDNNKSFGMFKKNKVYCEEKIQINEEFDTRKHQFGISKQYLSERELNRLISYDKVIAFCKNKSNKNTLLYDITK